MRTANPQSRGVLHVRVVDDLLLDGGAWKPAGQQKGWLIATITPPATPMFQQVVEYLEKKPLPAGGNMRQADEARTAVAVCLRWGSYFAVLADPSRPEAPNIADEEISQIDDMEMARMNIEISAALAWWLTLRGSDDRRYDDLVHRALAYLPTGPKTFGHIDSGDRLLVCTMPEMAERVHKSWPADRLDRDLETAGTHGIRVIANTITHVAFRNGPVENVHAGRFQGYGLDRRRVLPKADKTVVRHAQSGFAAGLKAADYLKYDNAWPPPAERVLPFLHGLVGPSRWSHTELSRPVDLPLHHDDQGRK
jgi:hypothetical protein